MMFRPSTFSAYAKPNGPPKPGGPPSKNVADDDYDADREVAKWEAIGEGSAAVATLIGGAISQRQANKQELRVIKAQAAASKKTGKSDALRMEAEAKKLGAQAVIEEALSKNPYVMPIALVLGLGIVGFVVLKVTSKNEPKKSRRKKKDEEIEEEED